MQHLQPSTLLQGGKYKIVRFLSNGGFGNTYEALDVSLNKRVAIKEFFVKDFCSRVSETTIVTITNPSKKALTVHLKNKFMDEARAIANMEHDNIVRVHVLFEENNTAYYVMDFIEGESLSDVLKRCGSLSEKEALPIILKVADALDYMHKQNRFHLDVKPANIMLRKDGKVILIDFGSSKQYAEVGGENTTTLAPCYTPGYAPSEQMNPKPSTFTPATDVYALGATLYKMLTGVTPPSAIDLQNEEESLSALPGDISQGVRNAIENAMRPSRKNRLQSVNEFVSLLPSTDANASTHTPGSPNGDDEIVKVRLESKTHKWGYLIGALLIGIVMILIGYVCISQYTSTQQDPTADGPDVTARSGTDTRISDSGSEKTKENAPASVKDKPGTKETPNNTPRGDKQSKPGIADPTKVPVSSSSYTSGMEVAGGFYVGSIRNGKPHGKGKLTFNGDVVISTYDVERQCAQAGESVEGNFENGVFYRGIYHSQSGDKRLNFGSHGE